MAKTKTKTFTYDVAERLCTPEEMSLYLDACIASVTVRRS